MILNLGILLLVLVVCEIFLQIIIKYFRRDFQWLITEKDSNPFFDKIALKKFINNSFDKELGWVRKPNTTGIEVGANSKIIYHIDSNGSRVNLVGSKVTIASFGDSYTFGRQVEDFQTWQVRLSEKLGEKVLNYGVGNYGADQAFLYYQRQKIPKTTQPPRHPPTIIIRLFKAHLPHALQPRHRVSSSDHRATVGHRKNQRVIIRNPQRPGSIFCDQNQTRFIKIN